MSKGDIAVIVAALLVMLGLQIAIVVETEAVINEVDKMDRAVDGMLERWEP